MSDSDLVKRPASRISCCVKGCGNTRFRKPSLPFYCFPGREYERERKEAWIRAVRRPPDKCGNPWEPGKRTFICGDHFIGGRKSNHPLHPAYNPSIFPYNITATAIAKRGRAAPREVFVCESVVNKVMDQSAKKDRRRVEADPLAEDYSRPRSCVFIKNEGHDDILELDNDNVINNKQETKIEDAEVV